MRTKLFLPALVAACLFGQTPAERVVVHPRDTGAALVNPGMG